MVTIEIHIPKKLLTALLILTIGGIVGYAYAGESNAQGSAMGGSAMVEEHVIKQAEEDIRLIRAQQHILEKQEDILRYELKMLDAGRRSDGIDSLARRGRYRESSRLLTALMNDKSKAEALLLESLNQMWEAQGRATVAGTTLHGTPEDILLWPVQPIYGISAGYLEPEYEEHFGMKHYAVDIPIEQGTEVAAAADGVVIEVNDNGFGYSSISIRHGGSITLYGHLSGFAVREGQRVRAGDIIGLSGGLPGTPGAGLLSTGPHLHFEVVQNGRHVDPLDFLPQI